MTSETIELEFYGGSKDGEKTVLRLIDGLTCGVFVCSFDRCYFEATSEATVNMETYQHIDGVLKLVKSERVQL